MYKALHEMFKKSTFAILDQKYVMATVETYPADTNHFMISQDEQEITVITEEAKSSHLDIIKKNEHSWFVVALELETPFMQGTLAAINTAYFEHKLNNFIVSTFSKDYILIRDVDRDKIREVFQELGFTEK